MRQVAVRRLGELEEVSKRKQEARLRATTATVDANATVDNSVALRRVSSVQTLR